MEEKTLVFKWTVSKGRDTYGYNICTLRVDGKVISRCNGGGYDMKGTCLGEFIEETFPDELKALKGNHGSGDDGTGFYGLAFRDKGFNWHKTYQDGDRVSLDGACGFSSMERILKALGYALKYVHSTSQESIYLLRKL